MSLVEEFHRAHKERLARMTPKPLAGQSPIAKPIKPPRGIKPVNPEFFYRSMWFYDLINPRNLEPKPYLTVMAIRDAVCKYFGVAPRELESSRRSWKLVHPRQCAFYLARHYTTYSFPQIGRRFGDRDHTTILHGVRRVEEKIKADWTVAYDIAHLEAML